MEMLNFNEVLAKAGWTEDSIKKIYHGGDHVCRCGCAGKYFKRGTPGFTRAINALRKGFMTESEGDKVFVVGYGHNEMQTSNGVEIDKTCYINIPEASDPRHNRCYCLYCEDLSE